MSDQSHRRREHARSRMREHGFATAEFAVAMPAVVLVLAAVVGMLQALLLHHQALHAAGVGARVAARGESEGVVRAAVARTGPSGARFQMRTEGELVVVRVQPTLPAAVTWAVPDLGAEVSALREDALPDGETAE